MEEFDGPVLFHHDETMPPIEPGTFGFGGLSRRGFLAGGGALALSAFLAACGGSSDDSSSTTAAAGPTTPVTTANALPSGTTATSAADATTTTVAGRVEAKTETITIGVPSLQEANVDPQWATGGLIFPLMWAVSDFLYMQDRDGKFVPTLATGFTLSADKLTWTFKLRSGVKMHDGSTMTAKDVKTAVDRVTTGPSADKYAHLGNFKSNVTGANVVDDLTVEVTTNKPYATLVVDMAPPIATDYYTKVGEDAFKAKPVCTGPWKFVSQELNANVKYERHDDYWDKTRRPNWRKLVYAIVPDESARVAGIKTGTLDIAYGLTASTADGFKNDANVKITEIKETGLGYCMMYDNALPGESPLKDARVRRALLMAIDRDAIAKALYKGYATTPVSAVPKITPGFNPAAKAVPYDPEGAKKLLAEAGVGGGFELTLSSYTTSTVPDLPKVAETIVPYWQAIGVKATLSNVEAATYLPQFRNKQLKGAAMIAGPTFFYIEPVRLSATSFFWTKAPYTTVVGDTTIDGLVDQLNVETDFEKRSAIGRRMADYLDEQLFGLPVVLTSSLIAVGPNVTEFGFIQSNPYAGPTAWILAK